MNNLVSRYYRRKTWSLEAQTLTPLFLGGANQRAEWRAEPFKALLRYWWRLTQRPGKESNYLRQEEARLFGSAGEEEGESGQSLVRVQVNSSSIPMAEDLRSSLIIGHPEVKSQDPRRHQQVEALLYLANMGLLEPTCKVKPPRSYFPPGSDFTLNFDCSQGERNELEKALALVQAFGALGSRCRNGWGSFRITSGGLGKDQALGLLHEFTHPWQEGFSQDYPTCLGKDEKGLLLWKTREPRKSWEEAMMDLAKAYVGVRAQTVNGIGPLDANGKTEPSERHLLGFPLTNHPAEGRTRQGWGKEGRHASPLRFVVRGCPQVFVGFVLHVPHRFSDKMTEGIAALQMDRQMAVWEKVHRKLDLLMDRAAYEECL